LPDRWFVEIVIHTAMISRARRLRRQPHSRLWISQRLRRDGRAAAGVAATSATASLMKF
jgi:hypothetical protein